MDTVGIRFQDAESDFQAARWRGSCWLCPSLLGHFLAHCRCQQLVVSCSVLEHCDVLGWKMVEVRALMLSLQSEPKRFEARRLMSFQYSSNFGPQQLILALLRTNSLDMP